ncbi:hypothetical protein IWQ51_001106 [Labrenzia sp. EL_142]|nr:hypothetical protein [Labrenzia sp. EL_142]
MTGHSTDYRTLNDGSIDLAFYDKRARAIRSNDAYNTLGLLFGILQSACSSLLSKSGDAVRNAKPTAQGTDEPVSLAVS